ncbi:hypothetical protein INT48_001542 [Thamnidium elegans]|uniref:Uncharacterized protein n=1 Tax=Thamnidium elegans TaxID=101142 RepID=A0A8H7SQ49_9FUNG|nr:hypothetical protein INT48_001542 [Thamnidium elegans]
MSYTFYFEDGAGNIVNENGEEPMDITEDENPFKLEELTSYTEYLNARAKFLDAEILQDAKAKGNRISNEIKARAVHLVDVHPKNSTRAVALDLKLEPRTPTSTIDQLMEQLNTSFDDLMISKRTLYRYMADLWLFSLKRIQMEPEKRNSSEKIQQRKEWVIAAQVMGVDYMTNCVFIDEAGFNANLRRTQGWAPIGETPIVKVKTARANSIFLGATSPKSLIKVCLRKPVPPPSSKKRKLAGTAKE